jgi:hypothetical protein
VTGKWEFISSFIRLVRGPEMSFSSRTLSP